MIRDIRNGKLTPPRDSVAHQVALRQAAIVLSGLDYHVPVQDLSIPLDRMPTKPRDGFVIADVKVRQPAGLTG